MPLFNHVEVGITYAELAEIQNTNQIENIRYSWKLREGYVTGKLSTVNVVLRIVTAQSISSFTNTDINTVGFIPSWTCILHNTTGDCEAITHERGRADNFWSLLPSWQLEFVSKAWKIPNGMIWVGTRVEKDPAMLQGQEHFLGDWNWLPYACMGSRLIETTRDSAFLFFLSFLKEENRIRLLPIPIKKSI